MIFVKRSGFTLIELVIVIVIIGIITAISAPRFFKIQTFEERGYYDEVMAAVRYAHKAAMASGCNHRVNITSSGYEITKHDSCDSGTFQPIQNPATGENSGYIGTKPSGISSGSLDFYYDDRGQPFTIGGNEIIDPNLIDIDIGSRTIQVEPYTGFVHD